MFIKKYNSIMDRSEEYRRKWALGLTITLSVFIFIGFAFYKGYLGFGNIGVLTQKIPEREVAAVISADVAPSPLSNSKDALKAAFGEIADQYLQLKKSISDVLVPFVTGMEVYKRE